MAKKPVKEKVVVGSLVPFITEESIKDAEKEIGMTDRGITQKDLDESPIMAEEGIEVGDSLLAVKLVLDKITESDILLRVPEVNNTMPGEAKKEDGEEMEITLTEEDLQMNPELVARGFKVGDAIKVPVDSFTGKLSDHGHLTETMAPYLDAYPTEKEFHITSDGQVFLKANVADAVRHQKGLDDKEEVFVYVR